MRTMSGGPCLHYDCSNRNSFGYCKTTVCINTHYQQEQWGSQSTANNPESVVIKQQTNSDRIRAMTDEELAIFLDDVQKYNICCKPIICDDCADCMTDLCWQCWRDWLKQEVEE